jgi:hypothetical protein
VAIQALAGRCESKGAAFEKLRAEIVFERAHLAADRRLLDAEGNVPHRRTNAAVAGDIIEQLQVVDVHQAMDRA